MHIDSEAEEPQGKLPHLMTGRLLWRVATSLVLAVVGLLALGATALAQTVTTSSTSTPLVVTATSTPTPLVVTATATPTPLVVTATSTSTPTGPTATPAPGLTLSPQQGPTGTSVGAIGTNFAAGDTVQLLFNGSQVDSQQADTTGLVSFEFNVPSIANGQYPVLATGRTGGSASVSFTVSGTSLTLSSQQGPPGTSVTVIGSGFQPGEAVTVAFNGAQVGTSTADTNGAFRETFTVPQLANGNYEVVASGQTGSDTASATFTVSGASVALSATSGAVGTSISAMGTGFTPGDAIRLIFARNLVTTQNADTNGNVSFTFAIPTVLPGNYLVVLSGHSGTVATAAFAVTGLGPTPVVTPWSPDTCCRDANARADAASAAHGPRQPLLLPDRLSDRQR